LKRISQFIPQDNLLLSIRKSYCVIWAKITSNEEEATTMAEVWMEVTFKGMDAPIKMEQVTVKQWEGDQVKHERFYYNA
ncbi:MAG: hypothetical protein AAFX57_20055, partial [Bacteroidota bacterium]